jgi:hypothetical protein
MHEVDLHDHTWDEAVRVFVDFYNQHMRTGSRAPLRVIHGYGSTGREGTIRRKLRSFLGEAAASLDWKPGEDLEGNAGVTIVYPRKILPAPADQLAREILAFCSIPRTESKIAVKFRTYGPREIKEAIRSLVRQGQMKEIIKASRQTYVNSS